MPGDMRIPATSVHSSRDPATTPQPRTAVR